MESKNSFTRFRIEPKPKNTTMPGLRLEQDLKKLGHRHPRPHPHPCQFIKMQTLTNNVLRRIEIPVKLEFFEMRNHVKFRSSEKRDEICSF